MFVRACLFVFSANIFKLLFLTPRSNPHTCYFVHVCFIDAAAGIAW